MIEESAKDRRLLGELGIRVLVRCLEGYPLEGVEGIVQVSAQVNRALRNTERSHSLHFAHVPSRIDSGLIEVQ